VLARRERLAAAGEVRELAASGANMGYTFLLRNYPSPKE
jgi:hypothetical protein